MSNENTYREPLSDVGGVPMKARPSGGYCERMAYPFERESTVRRAALEANAFGAD